MPAYKLLEGFHAILPMEAIVVNPDTDINAGDSVKIGVACNNYVEKFWASVINVSSNGNYLVQVDQDLWCTPEHGLRDGSKLVVERKHIVALLRGENHVL